MDEHFSMELIYILAFTGSQYLEDKKREIKAQKDQELTIYHGYLCLLTHNFRRKILGLI